MFVTRSIRPADLAAWLAMREALWPAGDHAEEIAAFFAGTLVEPQEVLIAFLDDEPVGVAELSIRTDIAGAIGRRVGYIEGLYVKPTFRGGALARRLVRAARDWAREMGCAAFGSDRADRVILDRGFTSGAG
jgi:aminoglycoside 6'-N-acetyltransferase I